MKSSHGFIILWMGFSGHSSTGILGEWKLLGLENRPCYIADLGLLGAWSGHSLGKEWMVLDSADSGEGSAEV